MKKALFFILCIVIQFFASGQSLDSAVAGLIKQKAPTWETPGQLKFDLFGNITAIKFAPNVFTQSGSSIEWLGDTGSSNKQLPYLRSAYFASNGAFYTGVWMIISNKRVNLAGDIQGVSATPDGAEPSMLSISPDINGPCLAVEAASSQAAGYENSAALAVYDMNAIHGGQTSYSAGYGTKKFAIRGDGSMYWGTNLGTNILGNANIAKLVPVYGGLNFTGTLHVYGTISANKLVLPPYDTEQRSYIWPQEGEIIYNTTTHIPEYWNGTQWKPLGQ